MLGSLTIERDGVAVALSGQLPRTVLALLLQAGSSPLTPDRLTDLLWGEEAPSSAHSSLHVHLSKLRKAVGPLLLRRDGGYVLDRSRLELDADAFRAAVLEAAEEPAEAAGATLNGALELWRGAPLADFSANPALARWGRELEELWLHATVLRIDAALETGSDRELVPELQELIAANPYEEKLHAQLILALYRSGRQADAHAALAHVRETLADELGLEPGEQLKRLQAQMLSQDEGLLRGGWRSEPARPPSRTQPRPVHRFALPQPATPLVGRDREMDRLARLCGQPGLRHVTLTGIGGVGKTRLAIEHGRQWGDRFADGVQFVNLTELTDPRQVRGAIALALASREEAAGPTEHSLDRYLADRELLLVLDNFEQVIDAADDVRALLDDAPGLAVLVTSRAPLRIRGEHTFDVPPLGVSLMGDPGGGPAVELFVGLALALAWDFEASPQIRATIATICRALDGLPLAIELAAARTATLSVQEIEALLAEPLSVGGIGLRDLPERQRTLTAAIRWSYDLLSAAAQETLRHAAVFQGSFSAAGLALVCERAVELDLEELVEAGLLRHGSEPARFEILVLVRSFAAGELADAGESGPARARHREYFRARYADVVASQRNAGIGRSARERAPDHADLRAAAEEAIAAGDADAARTLMLALEPIWMASHLAESGPLLDAALAACQFAPEEEMALMSGVCYANSVRPEGEVWTRRRIARAAELGQTGALIAATANLVAEAFDQRDDTAALRHRDELLALGEPETLSPGQRAARATTLSCCAYLEGDMPAAVTYADASLAAASQGASEHAASVARVFSEFVRARASGAIDLTDLRETVALSAAVGVPEVTLTTLWLCARYAADRDPAMARELLALAEHIAREHDIALWPEEDLRDESLARLGIDDLAAVAATVPPRDVADSLRYASAWLTGLSRVSIPPRIRPEFPIPR